MPPLLVRGWRRFSISLMPNMNFPARFEFLDEIREFVAQVAREGGFTDKEIYSLQLAADEAASNIIEHAYEGISNADIDITCNMYGDTLTITMLDTGISFNPSKVKQPNLKADLSDRQIGGLGVYLMRKLMDEVRYESNSRTGNLLTMTKRRG
jgi:serine/threonine-protein kinase RsbW